MSYDELYEKSWDLYKREMVVNSLGTMMMGEVIATFLDRGYYLLRLTGVRTRSSARLDRGLAERVRIDIAMHNLDLGELYSFGGICEITVWKGIQRDLSKFASGELKQMLSEVRGNPEPGVYMVFQDGMSYFVGTTIYVNVMDYLDLDHFVFSGERMINDIDDVLAQIGSMDPKLEVE